VADPETLEGTVLRVVYRAPDGGFAVLRLEAAGRAAPTTVIGPLGDATAGERLRIEGAWEKHATHGEQFRAQRAVVEIPRSPEGVGRYLEGLSGIGPELARRLVAAFGTDAVEVVEKEPWRAAQVKGMGKRRAETAARQAAARRQEREVMIFLQGLGVSLAYATRIRKAYGADAVARVRENPYRLARDVSGIGFFIADRIARGMGIDPASPLRIEAGLLHVLSEFTDEGHAFAARAPLVDRVVEGLEVAPSRVADALAALARDRAVVIEDDAVYLPWLHRAERELAEAVRVLAAAPRPPPPAIAVDERLSAAQRAALRAVSGAGVAVLTGGPGTGKTTVLRALVASFHAAKRRVLLCAPTGRAARRLADATGRAAQTIHRLLEWGRPTEAGGGSSAFGRGPSHPLEVDLLIVDEASMLDLPLARALVQAVPPGATLVLVGDVDQLPSVGPGQVLADLIQSGVAPVARLTEVFRQAEGSGIVENAYRILGGELPVGAARAAESPGGGPDDFYVVPAEHPERARDLVVRMCRERIPEAFGLDPLRDVQVLSPMHRGAAGTDELNRALQAALNPGGAALPLAGRTLRIGDKVMQVRNDYERDVYNGDVGQILAVAGAEEEPLLDVDFDGRRVRYAGEAIDQLELAYAVSVHKSQGSEYPAVVLALLTQHSLLLRRNLLYTAVTRGKRLVVIVGSQRALRHAVERGGREERNSRLAARLRDGSAPIGMLK
jgi:exodeoxyribonuclease V alpha subunit